jgi:1D-myo-inositol 3-kinase
VPRLLAVGHVTWDRLQGKRVLGGSATYAALAARKLGWEAAALTAAGPDFEPGRDLEGVEVFNGPASATTQFVNTYEPDGTRRQVLTARASDVSLEHVPDGWRGPDALLLGAVAGEIHGSAALAFEAGVVGANAQGWLRGFDDQGRVHPTEWADPAANLAGVHILFLSEHDLPEAGRRVRELLAYVPIVALTRGWQGLSLHTRDSVEDIPSLPREEVDPTGAGDVFASAFLVRYHETGELVQAAAFAACAASCVVEGLAASALGDRAEVERRLVLRERLIDDGEWEE